MTINNFHGCRVTALNYHLSLKFPEPRYNVAKAPIADDCLTLIYKPVQKLLSSLHTTN